jgi:hypothetical protein
LLIASQHWRQFAILALSDRLPQRKAFETFGHFLFPCDSFAAMSRDRSPILSLSSTYVSCDFYQDRRHVEPR